MSAPSHDVHAVGRAVEARIGAAHGRMSPAAIGAAIDRVRRDVGVRDTGELLARFEAGDADVVRRLVAELTVGETYFFRDPEQIAAIVRFVGEALAQSSERIVHVWSAGCASGEEPYSIAIRCLETFGPEAERRVRILATDVSPDAIATAERGIFRAWSFRATTAAERERWFDPSGRVIEPPRRIVRFAVHNLLDHGTIPRGLDVVVCRNVLLYFSPERALETIEALGNALAPEGWLVLGPADPPPLTPRIAASVVAGKLYYRRAAAAATLPPPRDESPTPSPREVLPLVERARSAPTPTIRSISLTPAVVPSPLAARIDAAHALADMGHESRALASLDALARESPELRVFLARAVLRSALGDQAGAARDASRALHLDATSAVACVILASAQAALGDAATATHAAQRALELLEPCDALTEIPNARGLRAQDLRDTVARIVRSLRRARRAP
ncbi:MAG: CheR family methyltransferase [Sandaracinus sp.]